MKLRITTTIFAMSCLACAGTFEEAKLSSPSPVKARSPELEKECDSIDSSITGWGATTKVLAGAAGASGFSAWAVRDANIRQGLVIGAGASGLAALGSGYIWDQQSKKWVRKGCAQ